MYNLGKAACILDHCFNMVGQFHVPHMCGIVSAIYMYMPVCPLSGVITLE